MEPTCVHYRIRKGLPHEFSPRHRIISGKSILILAFRLHGGHPVICSEVAAKFSYAFLMSRSVTHALHVSFLLKLINQVCSEESIL